MARAGDETKAAAGEVLKKLFAVLADAATDTDDARGEAIVALSTMAGAMTLARIADQELSAEILERAKDHLRR
jgi:TetR/AcrR family transcriptional repressor of nem operon